MSDEPFTAEKLFELTRGKVIPGECDTFDVLASELNKLLPKLKEEWTCPVCKKEFTHVYNPVCSENCGIDFVIREELKGQGEEWSIGKNMGSNENHKDGWGEVSASPVKGQVTGTKTDDTIG